MLIILLGFYGLYAHFNNPLKSIDLYYMDFTPKIYLIWFTVILIFLMSIISLVLYFLKKLPKITLIYPIYNVILFIVWLNLIPAIIGFYYADETIEEMTDFIDEISSYDFIAYFFDIGFSLFILYRSNAINILKNKNSFKTW